MGLSTSWCGVKDQKVIVHLLVHLHYSSLVAASVTVIWRREYSHDSFVMTPVVSIHHKLMRSRYQLQTIGVIEILRNVLPKCESGSSGRDTPTMSIIWVRPQEIAHWTLVWHLHLPVDLSHLIQGVQVGRQSSVQTEYLALDHSCQWK